MVSIGFIVTHRTAEDPAPLFFDPLALPVREPLSLGTAVGAILGCPMGVHLDRDEPLCVIFVSCVLLDFAT